MANVTIFSDIYHLKEPHYISIEKALDRIKNGASRIKVQDVRNAIDKDKANEIKKFLPCLLFAGTFKERADDALIEHSGLIVLDFDEIDVDTVMAELYQNKYIYAAWRSPRNNGIKALVKIADGSKHRLHFAALQDIFPNVDKSGANESRVCYESYDPELWVKESEIFTKIKTTEKIEQRVIVQDDRDIFKKLLIWIANKKGSFVKGERNSFIFKLAGACCRYGIRQDAAEYMIVCEYPPSNDFTQKEASNTIKSAYKKNGNSFGTAVFDREILVDKTTRSEVDIIADMDIDAPSKDVVYGQSVKSNAMRIYEFGYESVKGIGVKEFDELFKMKRGEVTGFSGIGNYGKSAINKWLIAIRILLFGEKTAAFVPEDNPPEEYYHDFVEILLGRNCAGRNFDDTTNLDKPSTEEYSNCYDFVSNHIFYCCPVDDVPTPDYILEVFLEMIIKEKVDIICVDPWNQLSHVLTGRTDQYLEAILGKWQRFSQKNNVYSFIVMHPKQVNKLSNGNYECPDAFDMAGGAMWNNKLENLLIYHRPFGQTDPNNPLAEFHTKKIKRQKIVGRKGHIEVQYVRSTRRFEINGFDVIQKIKNDLKLDFSKPIRDFKPAYKTEMSDTMKRFIEKNGFQTQPAPPPTYWNETN